MQKRQMSCYEKLLKQILALSPLFMNKERGMQKFDNCKYLNNVPSTFLSELVVIAPRYTFTHSSSHAKLTYYFI